MPCREGGSAAGAPFSPFPPLPGHVSPAFPSRALLTVIQTALRSCSSVAFAQKTSLLPACHVSQGWS